MKALYTKEDIKKTYKIMNKYDEIILCNGCSPSWLTEKMPAWLEKRTRFIRNLIFLTCCSFHDLGFFLGGNKKDFKERNKEFKICNYSKADNVKNGYSWVYFKLKSWEYYKLVSWFGKSSFHFTNKRRLLPSFVIKPNKLLEIEKEFSVSFKLNIGLEIWYLKEEDRKKLPKLKHIYQIFKPVEIIRYEKNHKSFILSYFELDGKVLPRWILIFS